MQDFIDTIMGNLPFFIGLFVFVVFTAGFVFAMTTQTGRDALGRAAVRLAVAALAFAEKWLGREITGDKLADMANGKPIKQHPIISAQTDLQSWLAK